LSSIENRARTEAGGRTRAFIVPECTSLAIVSGVLSALEALHSLTPSPLAHRDIKAENVLLAADGVSWKLCDFGSASACSLTFSSSSSSAIAKEQMLIDRTTTPCYRAPEMWDISLSRQQVGTKVDMWMLGCLLFRICFGSLPFADANKLQIMDGRFEVPLVKDDPRRHDEGVSFLISQINAMLVVDPSARMGSEEARRRFQERHERLKQSGLASSSLSSSTTSSSSSTTTTKVERNGGNNVANGNPGGSSTRPRQASEPARVSDDGSIDSGAQHQHHHHGTSRFGPRLGRMLGRGSSSAAVGLASGAPPGEASRTQLQRDGASRTCQPQSLSADTSSTEKDDRIAELTKERDALLVKVRMLQEYAAKQAQEIAQLQSTRIMPTTPGLAVETGWATGWNGSDDVDGNRGPSAVDGDDANAGPLPTPAVDQDAMDHGSRAGGITPTAFASVSAITGVGDLLGEDRAETKGDDGATGSDRYSRRSSSSSSDGGYDSSINFGVDVKNQGQTPPKTYSSFEDAMVRPATEQKLSGDVAGTDLIDMSPKSTYTTPVGELIDLGDDGVGRIGTTAASRPLMSTSNPFSHPNSGTGAQDDDVVHGGPKGPADDGLGIRTVSLMDVPTHSRSLSLGLENLQLSADETPVCGGTAVGTGSTHELSDSHVEASSSGLPDGSSGADSLSSSPGARDDMNWSSITL